MSFPISKLIEHQGPVVTIEATATVQEALEKMIASDFSQLPIVDIDGKLVGLVTEQMIVNTYFHTRGLVPVLDVSVDNCSTQPVRISKEADVFEALRQMRNTPALVVVEDDKPIGMVTYYDTTDYFRVNNEGMMFVADIEQGLRQYVESICSDSIKLEAALINAFGEDKQSPGVANKRYDKLTLYDQMQLLTHEGNWPEFEPYFRPLELFVQLMNRVRVIRNQLAHFRNPIDSIQRHALLHTRSWLDSRPKVRISNTPAIDVVADVSSQARDIRSSGKASGRYDPLKVWLEQQPASASRIQLTFQQIEELLGAPLSATAYEHNSWWANDSVGHVQSKYWLDAGWRVNNVNLEGKAVVFERGYSMYYHEFFITLLDWIRQTHPTLIGHVSAAPRNWLDFSAGRPGFRFGWCFTRRRTLRVELTIDTGQKERNQALFEQLRQQQKEIEAQLGFTLNWESLEHRRSCRVGIEKLGSISDPEEKQYPLLKWAADTMVTFVNVLRPYIEQLTVEA